MAKKKAAAGTVIIQPYGREKTRLRLVWTFNSQRYFLALGLENNSINQRVAEIQAKTIELDMATSNFDPTLEKYRSGDRKTAKSALTVQGLLDRFIQEEKQNLSPNTTRSYLSLSRQTKTLGCVDDLDEKKIGKWLANFGPAAARKKVTILKSCWKWAIEKSLIPRSNPWIRAGQTLKPINRARPKPFSIEEARAIIEAFRNHPKPSISLYADYVEFQMSCGTRPGESAALRFENLSDDCSIITIEQSYSRGNQKETKTGKIRSFRVSARIQQILKKRKEIYGTGFIFRTPKNRQISDGHFRKRIWIPILEEIGIPYRKPYSTRHTTASHLLNQGIHHVVVAEMLGHNPETLYRHYAGSVGSLQMMDFLSPADSTSFPPPKADEPH